MAFAIPAITLALAAIGAQAAPNLNYALMDQQPPVARTDQPFVFTLLPSTFNDSRGDISYTTSGMPSWLSYNTGSAAFYGTPSSSDEGQQNVTLTATDSDGSTDAWFNLIVTNFTVPAVHQGFATQISGNASAAQLASVERLPEGTGVSVPPYWSFSLGFLWETFRLSRTEPINGNLFFSARERGSTTLPSWLSFNNQTMTFGGVAPPNGTFTIVATGTDFWGYTGAQTSFIIQVGEGEGIETRRDANFTDIQTVSRAQVDYDIDFSEILIGGEPATADQVTLSLDSPDYSWLSIDGSKIVGTTPDSYENGTVSPLAVPLTIGSTNSSNTLQLIAYIGLDVAPYPFTSFEFPNVTADPGEAFEFDLSPYIRDTSTLPNMTILAPTSTQVNTSVFPTEAAEWLTFHEGNMTLEGTPPANPNYDHVEVEFTIGQGASAATETLRVDMDGVNGMPPTGGTTSVPSTTASESSSSGGGGLSTGARIAIGVVFGLLGLILLILLLWFCCRRRKRNQEAEQKEVDDDGDSFVVGSPSQDPFRKSNHVDPPRNLLGEIAKFSGFHIRSPDNDNNARSPEMQQNEKPHRLDGLRGIFGWGEQAHANPKKEEEEVPGYNDSQGSFLGRGDVISVRDPVNDPNQSASSFDQTFGSSTDSRASWESRQSFQWSSQENDDSNENRRISAAPSIPRPRQDFTPRYPRNNSPSRLAHLASQHTLNSPEFSEFHGSSGEDSLANTMQSSSLGGSSSSGNNHGNNSQYQSNGNFRSIDEEDEGEGTDAEGPAIVSMAERQSFETRTPRQAEPGTKVPTRDSYPAQGGGAYRQSVADSAFDDADTTEVHGLGYPASSIFGSPQTDGTRGVSMMSSNPRASYDPRSSTIRAIPEHESAMSPPLPQVGSFAREITHHQPRTRPTPSYRPSSMTTDGRVVACANETFSMHPTINPPPRIALSAATWSSNPPSTYRAEVEGGGSLPTWLHFDARELELWGVPALANAGDVTTIKVVEILPRDKRRSDPSQFGYEPAQEREVGRVTVEVVDRLKSPQFGLENSPHAY